jgi:hypothetical protein
MPIFKNDQRQNQFNRIGRIQNNLANGTAGANAQGRLDKLQTKLNPIMQRKIDNGKMNTGQINKLQGRMGTTTAPTTGAGTSGLGVKPINTNPGTISAPGTNNNQWADYMKALFPQTSGMDANIDMNQLQENPYYKQQQAKGEEALTRYNTARGLTNSTAEVKQFGDFNADLLGREFESKRQFQQQEADRAQGNAGRFFNLLDSDANRKERGAQNQFNNQLGLYNAMADQYPLEYGYGAANSRADMQNAYGQDRAAYAAQNYSRPSSGGYQGSMPSGPDYSGIDMMQMIQQGRNNQNQGSDWFDLGAGMLNAFS